MMKIRLSSTVLVIAALLVDAAYCGVDNGAPKAPLAQIRQFDVDTLAKLGREIYRHDQLAWVATDILLAKVSTTDLKTEGASGWVVDVLSSEKSLVRFIRKHGDGFEAAYDVLLVKDAAPALSVPSDRNLTTAQTSRVRALKTAERAVFDGKHPWCSGVPNTVVLDDPDGSGFLVYFLRPKPTNNKVPIGGHYRVTVSADGSAAERVDQLFASCLTMDKGEVPAGATTEFMVVSHIVSDTPLETHIFLSLQDKIPIVVVTLDKKTWMVNMGKITPFQLNSPESRSGQSAKSKTR